MSGLKRIAKFQTEDGREFNTEAEARIHLNQLEARQAIIDAIQPAFNTGRAESMMIAILNDPKPVRDALNTLIRKMPKANIELAEAA